MLGEDKLRHNKLATTELSFALEKNSLKFLGKIQLLIFFRRRVNNNDHMKFAVGTEQLQDLITGSHEKTAFKFCFKNYFS